MSPRSDVADNDLLKISTGKAGEIEEHIILLAGQILIDRQRPGYILTTVTDEDCLFNARHEMLPSQEIIPNNMCYNPATMRYERSNNNILHIGMRGFIFNAPSINAPVAQR